MNKTTALSYTGIILAAATLTARADLVGGAYSTSANVSSWNGAPVYTSLTSANLTGFTDQGNASLNTGAPNMVLGETFTPGSSFTLSSLAIIGLVNTTTAGMSLHLFDLGVVGGGAATVNGAYSYNPVTDLFGNGSGLTFMAVSSGGVRQQDLFTFDNTITADQVALTGGHTYAFEIWTPAPTGNQNNITWARNSVADAAGGQGMAGHDSTFGVARTALDAAGLAGGHPRTFTLALYSVPEPSVMGLVGLGALFGTFRLRRQSK